MSLWDADPPEPIVVAMENAQVLDIVFLIEHVCRDAGISVLISVESGEFGVATNHVFLGKCATPRLRALAEFLRDMTWTLEHVLFLRHQGGLDDAPAPFPEQRAFEVVKWLVVYALQPRAAECAIVLVAETPQEGQYLLMKGGRVGRHTREIVEFMTYGFSRDIRDRLPGNPLPMLYYK